MSGTGGLYPYAFGVFAALQDSVDVSRLRLETTSGTGFGAVVLFRNYPMRQVFDLWVRRKCILFEEVGWWKGLSDAHFFNLIYHHCMNIANHAPNPDPPWEGSHTVFVQQASTRRREALTDFETIEEWVGAITGSASFQPVPCRLTTFDWKRGSTTGPYLDGDFPGCKDGSLKDCFSFPLPGSRSVLRHKAVSATFMVVGIFTDQRWMYEEGYEDATRLLVPLCLAYICPRREGQVSSSDTHDGLSRLKPRFDTDRCEFTEYEKHN